LQVSVSEPQLPQLTIRVAFGVHAGAAPQVHVPQAQLAEHVSVP